MRTSMDTFAHVLRVQMPTRRRLDKKGDIFREIEGHSARKLVCIQ